MQAIEEYSNYEEQSRSIQGINRRQLFITEIPFLVQKPGFVKNTNYNKQGHWTDKEKVKYTIFLEFHKEKFINRQERRLFKIFKAMSDFLKTRNPNQCRSHHQKMQRQFPNLLTIIKQSFAPQYSNNRERLFSHYKLELIGQDKMMKCDEEVLSERRCGNIKGKIDDLNSQNQIQDLNKPEEKNTENNKKKQVPPTTDSYCDNQLQNIEKNRNNKVEINVLSPRIYDKKAYTIPQKIQPVNLLLEDSQIVKLEDEMYVSGINQNFKTSLHQKKQRLTFQCHSYWMKWISAVSQLEEVIRLEDQAYKQKMI